MKEKITNAVCNAPANAADTAKKTTSDVKTATAETPSESKSETAPQIFSLDLGDGDSYEGEMKDDKYHGMGTYRWGNGNVYTGEYVNGVRQGKGKFAFASGSSYEGEWKNGKYHGKGKWTNADGSYYTGVWENDDIIDSTKIEYPAPAYASESVKPAAGAKIERMEYDNGVYEGEMVNGSRHGKGKYTWNNGSEYEGDWVKGKKCGFGIYKSYSKNEKDGSTYLSYIYEGEWKDGKHHGRGVAKGYKAFTLFGHVYMNWSYDGPWVDDKKHGRGVYRDWDGNAMHDMWKVFEGEWVDDTRQGIFTMKYEPSGTGKTYINYYVDGNAEVWGAPYDPSIKTLEDARRAKEKESAKERREYDEKKSREAAQSRTIGTTRFDDDAMADLRYLYEMKSSGGTLSWSAEEQQKYQNALLGRKGDRDGVALAYVKQQVYANSLSSFEDVNFCIYLLNEIIPRENTLQELAICYYRIGWVQDASGCVPKRGLLFYEGRIQDTMEVLGGQPFSGIIPYSDEIMARRLLDKVIFRLKNTTNPANNLRSNKNLQKKVLLAEAYVKFAKVSKWQYQLTEIEEDLITLKTLMK